MNRRPLTRRTFITVAGGSALWLATGCRADDRAAAPVSNARTAPAGGATTLPATTVPATTVPVTTAPTTGVAAAPASSDHVLVLVQLLGGNDGLNTLVPLDGRYRDARPSLGLADVDLLVPAGLREYGLHPALAPLGAVWDAGRLAAVAGTGFEDQTRSHFDSRDVWWRGGASAGADGWLARWMDAVATAGGGPVEALAFGAGPRALAGSTASAVTDPTDAELRVPAGVDRAAFETYLLATSRASAGEPAALAAARASGASTLSTSALLTGVAEPMDGEPVDGGTPDLAVQLSTAAALITTRPALRVVTVGIEGFDTHAAQPDTHAALLGEVAGAIAGFWSALDDAGRARTLVLTTSEFGRRVAENGSLGTDHGRAGVQFALGGGVRGGQVIGGHDLAGLQDGDLPIVVPAEELFADALRWLGGPVTDVLGADPPATGLMT